LLQTTRNPILYQQKSIVKDSYSPSERKKLEIRYDNTWAVKTSSILRTDFISNILIQAIWDQEYGGPL